MSKEIKRAEAKLDRLKKFKLFVKKMKNQSPREFRYFFGKMIHLINEEITVLAHDIRSEKRWDKYIRQQGLEFGHRKINKRK